jgi:hypothetical protein
VRGRICFPFSQWKAQGDLLFIPFKFGRREGLVAVNMGNIKCKFAVHKSQATTLACRQITITGDGEIHVREKPD